jgi:hypothetical protein
MKFLAIERDVPGTKPEVSVLREEAARVWELVTSGVIRETYFTPEHQAVLVLECRDEPEAARVLASLPLRKHGLIDFELLELRPYDGFARLFAEVL